jgi:hypothetical protein
MSESSQHTASKQSVRFKLLLLAAAISLPIATNSTTSFPFELATASAKSPPDHAGRPDGAGPPEDRGNGNGGGNDDGDDGRDGYALGRTVIFPVYTDGTESFLRFANFGRRDGTAAVVLHDIETGAEIGEWVSPVIPAHGALEVSIDEIADAAGADEDSDAAVARITATFKGHVQHVGWTADDNVISNLTSCKGLSVPRHTLGFVAGPGRDGSSGVLQLTNAGPQARSAKLAIFNAATGERLAEWTSADIAGFAALSISIATLADEAGIDDDIDALGIRLEAPAPHLSVAYLEAAGTGPASDLTAGCPLKAAQSNDDDGTDDDDTDDDDDTEDDDEDSDQG